MKVKIIYLSNMTDDRCIWCSSSLSSCPLINQDVPFSEILFNFWNIVQPIKMQIPYTNITIRWFPQYDLNMSQRMSNQITTEAIVLMSLKFILSLNWEKKYHFSTCQCHAQRLGILGIFMVFVCPSKQSLR